MVGSRFPKMSFVTDPSCVEPGKSCTMEPPKRQTIPLLYRTVSSSMMMRRLLVVAIVVLVRESFAFVVNRVWPMAGEGGDIVVRTMAAISPLDLELESWASSSGYGSVLTSTPAGSSGWASFRRVAVSNPPRASNRDDDDAGGVSFFVKYSHRSSREMFDGEALGLRAMHACTSSEDDDDGLRIPRVYLHGDYSREGGRGSLLIMEYLNLSGRSDEFRLGRAVALMHLAPATEGSLNPNGAFGFPVDNTM